MFKVNCPQCDLLYNQEGYFPIKCGSCGNIAIKVEINLAEIKDEVVRTIANLIDNGMVVFPS